MDNHTLLALVLLDEGRRYHLRIYRRGIYLDAPATWYLWWMLRVVGGEDGGPDGARRDFG